MGPLLLHLVEFAPDSQMGTVSLPVRITPENLAIQRRLASDYCHVLLGGGSVGLWWLTRRAVDIAGNPATFNKPAPGIPAFAAATVVLTGAYTALSYRLRSGKW